MKRKIIYKKNLKESFQEKDWLMRGITYEDLIITVQSNEPVINPQVVKKVFNELYKANLNDALYELNSEMKGIIKEIE